MIPDEAKIMKLQVDMTGKSLLLYEEGRKNMRQFMGDPKTFARLGLRAGFKGFFWVVTTEDQFAIFGEELPDQGW